VEELQRELGIGPDQTTEDLKFTVKTVNCVGACAMAPVMIVGEKYWGNAKPARVTRYLGKGGASDEN
jgi:NADH-quinone oxidoreductase subunit E